MRRLLSLILAAALTLLALTSCSEPNRKYDAEEVAEAAEKLIKKSEKLNEIYWGTGIGWSDNDKNGYYYSARDDELERLGIKSVSDLKAQTLDTFSLGYSESIFYTLLSSLGDDDTGIVGYTRYFQDEDKLMVFSKYEPLLTDEVTYLYDTLKVTHSKGELVFVSVDARVRRGEAEQTRSLEIGFIEEVDGWKIDTPTYTVYLTEDN